MKNQAGYRLKEDFEAFEPLPPIIYSLKMFCNLSDDTITIVAEKPTLNVLFHIPRIKRSRQYPKTWSYPWKFCAKK